MRVKRPPRKLCWDGLAPGIRFMPESLQFFDDAEAWMGAPGWGGGGRGAEGAGVAARRRREALPREETCAMRAASSSPALPGNALPASPCERRAGSFHPAR